MNQRAGDPIRPILLVDDSPADLALTRRAFEDARVANPVVEVAGGEEAILWLRERRGGGPMPAAIFLDLRMPKFGGLETLRIIRGDPNLRELPVVMLTVSGSPDDVTSSLLGGASSYVVKPTDLANFMSDIGRMGRYWVQHNHPPR